MAGFDSDSIIAGLDGSDANSVRRVMQAVKFLCAGVPKHVVPNIMTCEGTEFNIAKRVYDMTLDNKVLGEMAMRFSTGFQLDDDHKVLKAAVEFDTVVTEAVMNPSGRPAREMQAARAYFKTILDAGPLVSGGLGKKPTDCTEFHPTGVVHPLMPYTPLGHPKNTDIQAKSTAWRGHGAGGVRSMGVDTFNGVQRTGIGAYATPETPPNKIEDRKRKSSDNMGIHGAKRQAFSLRSGTSDLPDQGTPTATDDGSDDNELGPNTPSTESEKKRLANKKHAPKRTRGDEVIEDDTYDKERAILSQKDKTKFLIVFNTERQDPAFPNDKTKKVPGNVAWHEYPHVESMDWNNPADIKRLNIWRDQIFKRNLGAKRESRYSWTEKERDHLVLLVQNGLATPEVAGRWQRLNWKTMAEEFNKYFKDKEIQPTDMCAGTKYPPNKSRNHLAPNTDVVTVPKPVGKTRKYPYRTPGAMSNQMTHFTDPICVQILHDAKEKDKLPPIYLDSDDESQPKEIAKPKDAASHKAEASTPGASSSGQAPLRIATEARTEMARKDGLDAAHSAEHKNLVDESNAVYTARSVPIDPEIETEQELSDNKLGGE